MNRSSRLLPLAAFLCLFVAAPGSSKAPQSSLEDRIAVADAPEGPTAAQFIEARFREYQAGLSDAEIASVSEAIVSTAAKNDVPWEMTLAVIHVESAYYNFAVSHVGALGLMQIMPKTGQELAEELNIEWNGQDTLFTPVDNVRMGTRYLSFLHGRYGDWNKALAAYNWGPHRIDWRLRKGRAMPVKYAHKVMALYQSPLAP